MNALCMTLNVALHC